MRFFPLFIVFSALSFLLGCACSPHKELTIIPPPPVGTSLSPEEIGDLRYGEVVKKYYVGAYVDPQHPEVRHDPHMIERLEQRSRWNLHPNAAVAVVGPTYQAIQANALAKGVQLQEEARRMEEIHADKALLAQNKALATEVVAMKKNQEEQNIPLVLKKLSDQLDQLQQKVSSLKKGTPSSREKMEEVSSSKQASSTQKNPTTKNYSSQPWEVPLQQ